MEPAEFINDSSIRGKEQDASRGFEGKKSSFSNVSPRIVTMGLIAFFGRCSAEAPKNVCPRAMFVVAKPRIVRP